MGGAGTGHLVKFLQMLCKGDKFMIKCMLLQGKYSFYF